MKKGQGSLEYLLILAAILAIAVVVIVVANSMIGTPQKTADLNKDKYECSMKGIELIDYTVRGTVSAVNYNGARCIAGYSGTEAASCQIADEDGTAETVLVSESAGVCHFDAMP